MVEAQQGTILFSGATASLRGGASFAQLAVPKFALRGLSQCIAREFQSKVGDMGPYKNIRCKAMPRQLGTPEGLGVRVHCPYVIALNDNEMTNVIQ